MEHEYMRTHYGEKYWDKLCGKPMPEESTPPIWKENYLLQQQYIEELERELNAVNQRIRRLEEAWQRVEDTAHSVQDWSGTALGDALDELNKAKEDKP